MSYLINFTSLPQSNFLYGGNAGLKRGVIYDNEKWLIKFPQETSSFEKVDISFTTSPLSEFVGSHIYEILGYKVHETVLGTFYNEKAKRTQLVVACKDFTDNDNLKLVDYESIKNSYSNELQLKLIELRERLPKYKTNGFIAYTLPIEEIILQFKQNSIFTNCPQAKSLFWEMLIIDCLINNNDRNKNNWGLLFNNNSGKYSSAPIYDNGASFVTKHTDEKLQKLLRNESALENSALNGMCYYTVGNELLNFKNFFRKLKENNLDFDFKIAVKTVVPLIERNGETLLLSLTIFHLKNEMSKLLVTYKRNSL